MPQSKIPAVRFNLKSHDKNDDLTPTLVILVFRFRGNKMVYSTGEKVKPKYWAKNRAKPNIRNHSQYIELNQRLNKLEEHCTNIFVENDFGKISVADFKLELAYRNGDKERPNQKTPTLFEFIPIYLESNKSKSKSLVTTHNLLKEFAEKKKRNIDYQDIEWQFRNDFMRFLYDDKNYSNATASKTIKNIKQFLNAAFKLNYHTNLVPHQKGYNIQLVKVKNKVRLSFDELRQLIDLDLSNNPRLERVRDLFIVGSYTGLRFSDWFKVKKENIHSTDIEGAETLSILTEKTKTQVYIPCLPELKAILEKYNYDLPTISNQKFNKYIKEVSKMVLQDKQFKRIHSTGGEIQSEVIEKWTKVSSHCARRSFATNFWELGIQPAIIMQVTGHATEKQFFAYIDVDKQELAAQFAKKVKMMRENKKLKVIK